MPTIDLSDEELQGLTLVLANASGPGISWMLTNALLMKAQQAAAISGHAASGLEVRTAVPPGADGLDHEPIAAPPAFTGKAGARR